jgi:hypothetical protein
MKTKMKLFSKVSTILSKIKYVGEMMSTKFQFKSEFLGVYKRPDNKNSENNIYSLFVHKYFLLVKYIKKIQVCIVVPLRILSNLRIHILTFTNMDVSRYILVLNTYVFIKVNMGQTE